MPQLEIVLPELHPTQREVWESKARFKVVVCGRRWGKTHLGVLACIVCAAKGGHAWWIAPTYKVANIGWSLLKVMCRAIPGAEIKEGDRQINFPGGGWVGVRSADDPNSLRGESLDLVVFDEVADIRQEAWTEAIRPALADRRGSTIFIGTPRGQANWLYDIFVRAQEDTSGRWQAWQLPSVRNPWIPPEEIEDARRDMHPLIAGQEFDAEFVMEGGTVFHQDWYREFFINGPQDGLDPDQTAVLQHEGHVYEICSVRSMFRFATVDPALTTKTSSDYTVIAAWGRTKQMNLCCLDVFRARIETPQLLREIDKMRTKWRLAFVAIEKQSFGTAIMQNAAAAGKPLRKLTADTDKHTRAYNAAPHAENGMLWIRGGRPWTREFRDEVWGYPLAKNDDCMDVVAYAVQQAQKLVVGPQLASW